MTPLHCATVKGRVETMNLLLSASPLCVAEATEGVKPPGILPPGTAALTLLEYCWSGSERIKALVVINVGSSLINAAVTATIP